MRARIFLAVTFLFLAYVNPAQTRTIVSAPQPNTPGNTIYQPDLDIPLNPQGTFEIPCEMKLTRQNQMSVAGRGDEVGGDDVDVADYNFAYHGIDLAVDSQGIFYSIGMVAEEDQNIGFDIRRSTDEGETWSLWASFTNPDPFIDYLYPTLHIAEGNQDQILIAYNFYESGTMYMEVASSPLGETASFTVNTVDESAGSMSPGSITSDATAYSEYYLYLAYSIRIGDSTEIRFTRSTDLGASWETTYSIASLNFPDRGYFSPKVSYGYGHYVHVAWSFTMESDIYDGALRYRRAPNFGSGGQGAWEGIQGLSNLTDGYFEHASSIAASESTDQILVGYYRREVDGGFTYSGVVASETQGADWTSPQVLTHGIVDLNDVAQNPVNLNWYIGGLYYGEAGYMWTPASDLTDWSDHLAMSDGGIQYSPQLVLNPAQDFRPAMLWDHVMYDPDIYRYQFDGEWRGDEGYPNHESGFPVDLTFQPVSDPALADLNGNGDLEIIFGDASGSVQVFQSDGTILPGWPRSCGTSLSTSPIAVGDMNGDGSVTVLVPTADGRVFGYNPNGTTAHGWPFDSGENALASVNLGNLGAPYRYVAVVISGTKMHFLNYQGNQVPNSYVWNNAAGFQLGCAIGDHDGDGVNEVIFRGGQLVLATEIYMSYTDLYCNLGPVDTSVPSLGDLDLDGNLEIVISTTDGEVHVLDDSGDDLPGWPQTFDPGETLSDPAIAHIWAGFEKEVAVCSRNWKTALFQHDGNMVPGYPVETDGWYIYGNPIMGTVVGSPDVIFGARGSKAWSFGNYGQLNPGWPKYLDNHCQLTPALGDLDQDGRNEIAFLTLDQLVVVDVGAAPWSAINIWAMTGHDAKRTGCSDCPEDLLSPIPEDPDVVTRISFAMPAPNPVAGQATFSFAVPVQAVIELAVYDLRGRRVALVKREEVIPGRHQITWNGRDDSGRSLASGNYIASLRVRGPGVDEQLNRKVTILR
ncbi:MAG: hypothetical protein GY780_08760 [bacterium]|nr:hypothetical protein [bacterium]